MLFIRKIFNFFRDENKQINRQEQLSMQNENKNI